MDPLSASCLTLNSERYASQLLAERNTHEKYSGILGSAVSLSTYETRNFKNLVPQLLAAVLVTSFHLSIGISLAYSAILVPQLQESSEIDLTDNQASWIASIIALTTPIGSLMVGFIMDRYGRLRTVAMAALPGISGCVIIALSTNFWMLLVGRGLVGFSSALGSSPAVVYLTEIARKDMRGSLISLAQALASLGMVLTFIMGWFMHWKQVAWCTNIFIVVPCLLVWFIPESPAWLVSLNRIEEARRSLMWIYKYQPHPEDKEQTVAEIQLALLQKEHELKMIEVSRRKQSGFAAKMSEFMKPTGYKPLLLLTVFFFFQQFSGIFVFLFYSITFFKDVGSEVDPYFSSMFIGILRFLMCMLNAYVLRTFGRRPLVILSCVTMSLCIFLSGLFTHFIHNGTLKTTWLPVVFLLLFVVASMIGLVPIPYTMTAELFPLEIRGIAQSVSFCIANFLMFLSLQLHPVLTSLFHGIAGVQFYFSVICLLAVVFVYIFLPETLGKTLPEIEVYFKHNSVFIGKQREKTETRKRIGPSRSIIRKRPNQEESLLEEA